jgi:uncharacterized membrane protein YgaE (UPF0421/DUF939 family)
VTGPRSRSRYRRADIALIAATGALIGIACGVILALMLDDVIGLWGMVLLVAIWMAIVAGMSLVARAMKRRRSESR